MRTLMNFLPVLGALFLYGAAFGQNKSVETVPHLDLSNYLGVWYEVASFPAPHQDNCVATQATYTLRTDGDIDVANECRDKTFDGKLRRAKGKAWVVDKVSQAKLKVRFSRPT